MTYPRNCWYVAAMSHEVGRELFPRTLLEWPVLMFRREDGSVAAIEDRCSHRRVSLSLGTLIGDTVQCGYHGLAFDGSGACTKIPNQQRIPPRACIRAYAIEERDGFIWIWMGKQDLADRALVPDYSAVCSSPLYTGERANSLPVQAPHLFNIENVLDLSHVTFVHGQTVGAESVAQTKPETAIIGNRIDVTRQWDRAAAPPLYERLFGWTEVKRSQTISFWPGANVLLHIRVQPAGNDDPSQVRNLQVVGPCTPSTRSSHFKFSAMYRDFALDDAAVTATITQQFHKTVLEDIVLMEDQQRNWAGDAPDVEMLDLAVDRAPLAARRMLQQMAESEQRDA